MKTLLNVNMYTKFKHNIKRWVFRKHATVFPKRISIYAVNSNLTNISILIKDQTGTKHWLSKPIFCGSEASRHLVVRRLATQNRILVQNPSIFICRGPNSKQKACPKTSENDCRGLNVSPGEMRMISIRKRQDYVHGKGKYHSTWQN